MVSTLFLRSRPRIAALLLVAGLYALVAVTAGASRLGLSPSSKGGAAPNLNVVARTLDPCNPEWSVVQSPNAATYNNLLNGVAAVSAGDVWAVGKDSNLGAPDSTLVEHWDGSAWSIVPSPNVGTDGSLLNGAVAISTGDVWAVGQYSNGTVYQTLVEHWNGSAWSVVPSPNLGSHENDLNGLAAISTNDVWAVGYGGGGVDTVYQTLIEHWDGSSWTIVPSPNAGTLADRLDGVAAVSAGDVWAVGDFEDTSIARHRALAEHWDGSSWTIVPSPNISNNHDYLYSVAAMSTNDVWAAGLSMPEPFMNQFTLVEHWDGSAWTIVPSPNVPGAPNAFYGLAGVGPDDIWAIGYDTPNNVDRTLTEHWDGSAWTIVPSPNVGTSYNYLYGLAAVPPSGSGPGDMWAVGQYDDPGNGRRTLIENFSSCSGSPTPAATSTAAPTSTPTRTFTSVPTLTNTSVPAATSTSIPTLTSTPTLTVASTMVPSLTSTSEPAQPTLTSTSTSTSAPALTSTSVATATSTSAPSSTATPCPNRFSDVHAGDYFYEPVIYLACRGVISGYPDGTFRPFNNATRGQMAKIVVLAFGIPIDTSGGPHFSDVSVTNPFYPYVETAYHKGIASGYGDSTFRPFNNVTRGQLSKIVVTAAVQAKGWALINPPDPTFRDVPFGSTFYRYIETAVSKGVVSGYPDDTFRPGKDATRGQISKIVFYAVTQP